MRILIFFLFFTQIFSYELQNVSIEENKVVFKTDASNFTPFSFTHKNLVNCEPKIEGVGEFLSENSFAIYPKNSLKAGIFYTCQSGKNKIKFKSFDFKVSEFNKISQSSFRIKFSDFVEKDELAKKLKIYSKNEILPFEISTSNEKEFFIKTKNYEEIIIENLNSKNKITIANFSSKNSLNFTDNPKAVTIDDFIVKAASFNDGTIGFRIFFKNWINASTKFIKVENIDNLSLKSHSYTSDLQEKERSGISDDYWFFVEFSSDEFLPNQKYFLKILPGFGDNYNLVREEKNSEFIATDYKPFFKFTDSKPYVSKNVSIAYEAINVPKIQIILEKVKDENYRYFINYGEYSKLFSQVLSKTYELGGEKNKKTNAKFDLDLSKFDAGIYKITAYFDEKNSVSRTIYLSDIAINAKIGKDGAFVYVNKISNLEKLDALITIYSENNEIIAEGKSYDGIFKIDDTNFAAKKPNAIVAKYKKDKNFIMLQNPLNSGDINYNFESKNLALISLVSDILRPGEKLLGSVIFKKNDFTTIANLPVVIKILSPKFDEIITKKTKTDEFGVVILDENLPKITGNYTIQAIFEDKILSSKNFNQEYFVPQRVKNKINLSKDFYFDGEIIEANLSSNYLFGGASANLQSNATLTLTEINFLKGYENFSFATSKNQNFLKDENKNFKLDENGEKSIIFKPNLEKSNSQIIQAGIRFETLDGTKSVGVSKSFNIYKNPQIIGIKAQDYYIKKGNDAKFKIISLNVKDFSDANLTMQAEIYRQVWEYNIQNDIYKWEKISVLEDTLKNLKDEFSYKFKNGGDYEIVLVEPNRNLRASVEIFSSGFGTNIPNNEIANATLKTDKNSYKPNDKVEISAVSVIENGVGLVTFSDTKVKISKIFEIKQGEISGEILLPKDFKGGYLNVSLISANNDKSSILRTFATKYLPLSNDDKKIDISYEIPKLSSNSKANIKIKTKPNSRVIFYAIDEGIAQIFNQPELDAFKFFDQPYFNGVLDYDFYELISQDFKNYKTLSFGGGDAMMAMKNVALKRFSDPINLKNVKNFMTLKDGISDEKGEITFEIEIPNGFNSQIKFTTIAINGLEISSKNERKIVSDEIVIKPGVILYALQGDLLKIPLNFINTTQENQDFEISLQNSKNLKVDSNQTKFSIKPNKTAQSLIKLSANEIGESFIKIKAKNYEYDMKFDVISPYNLKISSKSGIVKKHLSLNYDKNIFENKIEISSNPLSSVVRQSEELINYPYGSTLHKTSAVLGLLQMIDDLNGSKKADALRFVEVATKEILSRMKRDGSFGFWSETSKSDEYTNLLVADTIFSSKITKDLLNNKQKTKIINYLKNTKFDKDTNKIYAAYILAKQNQLNNSTLNYIFDNKIYLNSISNLYTMWAILDIFGLQDEKKIVKQEIKKFDKNLSLKDLSKILEIYGERKIPQDELSNQSLNLIFSHLNQNLYNPLIKVSILRALKAYLPNENVEFTLNLNGQISKHLKFSKTLKNLKNLEINSTKPVYFSVISYEKSKPALSHEYSFDKFKQNGEIPMDLKIYREFVDEQGKKVNLNKLSINQKIYSKITINSNFDGLLINEKVPSCFEIVNEKIYGNFRNNNTQNSAVIENQEINDYSVTNFIEKNDQIVTIFTPYKVVLKGKCTLPAVVGQSYLNEQINAYDLSEYEFTIK